MKHINYFSGKSLLAVLAIALAPQMVWAKNTFFIPGVACNPEVLNDSRITYVDHSIKNNTTRSNESSQTLSVFCPIDAHVNNKFVSKAVFLINVEAESVGSDVTCGIGTYDAEGNQKTWSQVKAYISKNQTQTLVMNLNEKSSLYFWVDSAGKSHGRNHGIRCYLPFKAKLSGVKLY